ncbi:hypothetical protein BHE74_00047374 [Ensete ventricosum]|nr:hypothetical protein BHE74_00047374 [Ensete ventricosum]RZS00369.1 hypothetical protein BHM03_00030065 [Ensete ventricosum]
MVGWNRLAMVGDKRGRATGISTFGAATTVGEEEGARGPWWQRKQIEAGRWQRLVDDDKEEEIKVAIGNGERWLCAAELEAREEGEEGAARIAIEEGYGRLEAGAIREKGEMVAGESSRGGRRGNSDGSGSKRFNHDRMSYRSDMNPRSSLGIGQGLDDAVGARRAFSRTSLKVSRRLLGIRQVIAGGRL